MADNLIETLNALLAVSLYRELTTVEKLLRDVLARQLQLFSEYQTIVLTRALDSERQKDDLKDSTTTH
jgi:hypothetical protein